MEKVRHFSTADIRNLERFYGANLINSITGYKPTNLIGTYSEGGIPNLALFTSVVHLGADPPLLGMVQRPVGEFSHTYKNIIKNGYYTINHVHEKFIAKAHYTSAKFDIDISEFDECGLTEEVYPEFQAPFVIESKIKMGMKFIREIPIEENNTIFILGKIEHLFVQESAILNDGNVDLNKVYDVCTSGLGTYHKVTKLKTFPYAKPNGVPKFM